MAPSPTPQMAALLRQMLHRFPVRQIKQLVTEVAIHRLLVRQQYGIVDHLVVMGLA